MQHHKTAYAGYGIFDVKKNVFALVNLKTGYFALYNYIGEGIFESLVADSLKIGYAVDLLWHYLAFSAFCELRSDDLLREALAAFFALRFSILDCSFEAVNLSSRLMRACW